MNYYSEVTQQAAFPKNLHWNRALEADKCLLSMFKIRLHNGQSVRHIVQIVKAAKKQSSLNSTY